MKLFVIKFKYDNGSTVDIKICIILADDEYEAKEKFTQKIYSVFEGNDDVCVIDSIIECNANTDLICIDNAKVSLR